MMGDPIVAAKQPAILTLSAGTYFWCACGRSQNQPFCDGSHQGTGHTPVKLVLEQEKKVALCQCKHTGNPPHCDGSHRKLG
jgi:CDGSH-type Zn-finger protein